MSKEETLIQARLVFEKTLFEYYEFLNIVHLEENVNKPDLLYVESTNKRLRDKLTLISKMSKKYGNVDFKVPILSYTEGNC